MGLFARKKAGLLSLIVVTAVLAGKADATSSIPAVKCPSKFIGTVTEVTKAEAPFTSLEKVKINLQVRETIRGNSMSSASFKVLKNGPVKFEKGSSYEVELRDQWVCSARLVRHSS